MHDTSRQFTNQAITVAGAMLVGNNILRFTSFIEEPPFRMRFRQSEAEDGQQVTAPQAAEKVCERRDRTPAAKAELKTKH